MAKRPPSLDEVDLLKEAETIDNGGRNGAAFSVRRFAGPHAHVDQLDHLRIAHLTDLHVGRITPMAVQYRAVDIANLCAFLLSERARHVNGQVVTCAGGMEGRSLWADAQVDEAAVRARARE